MRGPRIDFYNDMESEATESTSYNQGVGEISFHLRQIARDQRAAGYEQALREVLAHLGKGGERYYNYQAMEEIHEFAAERGMDLGQTRTNSDQIIDGEGW